MRLFQYEISMDFVCKCYEGYMDFSGKGNYHV